MGTFILVLLTITGLFLIFIILLQRGRGGGLAGALGGAGGQSAFGTKAGDVFTRITIGIALVWVLLACISIFTVAPATLFEGGANANEPPPSMSAEVKDVDEKEGELDSDQTNFDNFLKDANDGEDLDSISKEQQPAPETPETESEPATDKK